MTVTVTSRRDRAVQRTVTVTVRVGAQAQTRRRNTVTTTMTISRRSRFRPGTVTGGNMMILAA